ncbi:MAG: GAF domain-containing protein [Bacteroidota bacterium]
MPKIISGPVLIPRALENSILSLLGQALVKDDTGKCTFQVFDADKNELHLVAYEGFTEEFISHFKVVRPFDGSCCGRAIGVGNTVTVNDVRMDAAFAPHLHIVEAAGYRAVKSVPILGHSGKRLGVISTHFIRPKSSWNLDSLAGVTRELALILPKLSIGHQVSSL